MVKVVRHCIDIAARKVKNEKTKTDARTHASALRKQSKADANINGMPRYVCARAEARQTSCASNDIRTNLATGVWRKIAVARLAALASRRVARRRGRERHACAVYQRTCASSILLCAAGYGICRSSNVLVYGTSAQEGVARLISPATGCSLALLARGETGWYRYQRRLNQCSAATLHLPSSAGGMKRAGGAPRARAYLPRAPRRCCLLAPRYLCAPHALRRCFSHHGASLLLHSCFPRGTVNA